MEFPLDHFDLALEYVVVGMLINALPLRSRERAFYIHRHDQLRNEIERRTAIMAAAAAA